MNLTNLSPIDGRYQSNTKKLSPYFSEAALMRYRVMIELKYLLALCETPRVKIRKIKPKEKKLLEKIYQKFSLKDASKVKAIEKITDHDMKSIEYFIKESLVKTSLKDLEEFIHFALTSEDVNNLAHSLMFKEAVADVYLPSLETLSKKIKQLAHANKSVSLLALTHGQPATPTTLGKEMAIFYNRLEKQKNKLIEIKLEGKLNGATGNFSAHLAAFPQANWVSFSQKFIKSLDLKPNLLTTQIEPHDSLAEALDNIKRINNILIDFDQDMWLYISRGLFTQEQKRGEVGSSTMPHKINPWYFENSEGNLSLANAYAEVLSNKLPISRLQRDLRDSTLIRNQGMVLGHSILAYQKTLAGLNKLVVDREAIKHELNAHPEVVAEAIQMVLRKEGYKKPYEALKQLTRGKKITEKDIVKFIDELKIDQKEKDRLKKITPENYVGLADELVNII